MTGLIAIRPPQTAEYRYPISREVAPGASGEGAPPTRVPRGVLQPLADRQHPRPGQHRLRPARNATVSARSRNRSMVAGYRNAASLATATVASTDSALVAPCRCRLFSRWLPRRRPAGRPERSGSSPRTAAVGSAASLPISRPRCRSGISRSSFWRDPGRRTRGHRVCIADPLLVAAAVGPLAMTPATRCRGRSSRRTSRNPRWRSPRRFSIPALCRPRGRRNVERLATTAVSSSRRRRRALRDALRQRRCRPRRAGNSGGGRPRPRARSSVREAVRDRLVVARIDEVRAVLAGWTSWPASPSACRIDSVATVFPTPELTPPRTNPSWSKVPGSDPPSPATVRIGSSSRGRSSLHLVKNN